MNWVFQALPLAGCAFCLAVPLVCFLKTEGKVSGEDPFRRETWAPGRTDPPARVQNNRGQNNRVQNNRDFYAGKRSRRGAGAEQT